MRKTIRKDWLLVLMAIPFVSFYTPGIRETGNEKKVFREGVIHAVTGRLYGDGTGQYVRGRQRTTHESPRRQVWAFMLESVTTSNGSNQPRL